jgi:dTDP-4-dehydrorhamnose reductase
MGSLILISGGDGNLSNELKKCKDNHNLIAIPKKEMDITDISSVINCLDENKPDYIIHTAAITRPMNLHIKNPSISIKTNIIGTANIVTECIKRNIKLIYISTDYVYPGTDGGYCENSPLLPVNEYAWSKLGGECSVKLYKNSLILRMAICEYPFPHKKALSDIKKSYLYINDAAKLILKLKDEIGIINVGGVPLSPYEFAIKENKNIEEITLSDVTDVKMAKDSTMNISKLKKILNESDL